MEPQHLAGASAPGNGRRDDTNPAWRLDAGSSNQAYGGRGLRRQGRRLLSRLRAALARRFGSSTAQSRRQSRLARRRSRARSRIRAYSVTIRDRIELATANGAILKLL